MTGHVYLSIRLKLNNDDNGFYLNTATYQQVFADFDSYIATGMPMVGKYDDLGNLPNFGPPYLPQPFAIVFSEVAIIRTSFSTDYVP